MVSDIPAGDGKIIDLFYSVDFRNALALRYIKLKSINQISLAYRSERDCVGGHSLDEGFLNGDYNSLPLAAQKAGGRGAAVRQDVQGVGDQLGLVQGGRQHLKGGGQRVVLCEAGEDDTRRRGGGVAARRKCAFAAFQARRHSIFDGFSYKKKSRLRYRDRPTVQSAMQ